MMKQLVLKNSKNELIRFFNCQTNYIYLVYRKNKKRLDFCSSPDFFSKEPVLLVDEFKVDELEFRPVPGMDAVIECYSDSEEFTEITPNITPFFEKDFFQKILSSAVILYALLAFVIYNFQAAGPSAKREIARQHVVEIKKPPTAAQVKKIQLSNQRSLSSIVKEKTENQVIKKSLKKIGALAALGELSKSESKQKGGLNLTESKISQGPGFQTLQARAGSGGVQSQVYSKGMISSALGSGGNIRGGGGHGTKGTQKGGGSAGYGSLSLIGSGGEQDLSQSSEFGLEGGGLDFNIINREFLKKYNLFRACYLEASKKESDLKGLFQFYFQINKNGEVIQSRLSPSSPVQSQFISSCIFKNINQIKFPIHLESSVELAYSFDLSEL